MKHLSYIFVFLLSAFWTAGSLQAQETQRRTPQLTRGEDRKKAEKENSSGLPDLTVRAQNRNEQSTQEIGRARWMRVIYREIDLTKEKNAPLYYPTTSVNGMMNLFTIIFKLVSEGKLTVYEYVGDYEIFDDAHKLGLKDMLDKFHIMYEEIPAKGAGTIQFAINESDIPSIDVKTYYVKEAWYFDQNNSVFDVKTLAVCPILTDNAEYGEQKMPMFWLPYEEIRPYISNSYIMTSNLNNAKTFTIDDYFRKRMFDGQIIKTENLMNVALQAYCPTPDSMKREQERIEKQLTTFEESLWVKPDTTLQANTNDKKTAKKSSARRSSKDQGVSASKQSASKEKAAKAPKQATQKSSPVRSVRRGR